MKIHVTRAQMEYARDHPGEAWRAAMNSGERRQILATEIARVINSHSAENASNTPDFILASYLVDCLEAFEQAVNVRETWYGRKNTSVSAGTGPAPVAPKE